MNHIDVRTTRRVALAGIFALLTLPVGPARAQDVARLNYLDVSNFVEAEVFQGTGDRDTELDSSEGTWSREVSASLVTYFGNGSSQVTARNEVTDLGFRTRMSCSYDGNVGTATLDVQSIADLITVFTVDQPVVGTLRGTVDLGGASGVQLAVYVNGAGIDLRYDDTDLGGGTITIDEPVFLEPGSFYFAGIEAFAGDVLFDTQSFGSVDLDITLDIGDEDRDGLPDVWERDGIDFDGDGIPEIPLFAYGAQVDRKDVFVEIDVQQSSIFPRTSLSQVVTAFANAPVDNPDGSQGITLHLMVDERNLPDLAYPGDDAGLKAAVAAQKSTWFGTQQERGEPDWSTVGRDYKRIAFRYAVLGGSIADGSSGFGEIPGNDFVVATDDASFGNWIVDDQVATFMHELGHTLGLRHGGDDDLLFKPNYLSVMNYSFQVPSTIPSTVGWVLDFSRSTLPPLAEASLSESAGIAGDATLYAGRRTLFNAAPSGSPRNIAFAGIGDGLPVDFDGDGNVPETSAVQADLNHIDRRRAASPGETLRGHDDWQNLHLHYSGSDNFDAGVATGSTTASTNVGAMTPDLYAVLLDAFGGSTVTSVEPDTPGADTDFRLALPRPNPSSGSTTLGLRLAREASVELVVHDLRGRRVATVVSGVRGPGTHRVTWNGHDDDGHPVGSGQYFAVLRVDGADRDVRKITLVR